MCVSVGEGVEQEREREGEAPPFIERLPYATISNVTIQEKIRLVT